MFILLAAHNCQEEENDGQANLENQVWEGSVEEGAEETADEGEGHHGVGQVVVNAGLIWFLGVFLIEIVDKSGNGSE